MLLYGPLVYQYDFEHSGKDDTGLGRLVVMVFQGSEGIKTRIVYGYNLCYNKKMESRTSYQQKRIYLVLTDKYQICLRKSLHNDLIYKTGERREIGSYYVWMRTREFTRRASENP